MIENGQFNSIANNDLSPVTHLNFFVPYKNLMTDYNSLKIGFTNRSNLIQSDWSMRSYVSRITSGVLAQSYNLRVVVTRSMFSVVVM